MGELLLAVAREDTFRTSTMSEWSNCAESIMATDMGEDAFRKLKEAETKPKVIPALRKAQLQLFRLRWEIPPGNRQQELGDEVFGYATIRQPSPISITNIFGNEPIHEVRLRFYNLMGSDDAGVDIRCANIKFADHEKEGPIDMAFKTGKVPLFYDLDTLDNFLDAVHDGETALMKWTKNTPANYTALVECLRKAPGSWQDLDYYNHVTYSVCCPAKKVSECEQAEETETDGKKKTADKSDKSVKDEKKKLVRFRLKGDEDAEECHLDIDEQEHAWIFTRNGEDKKAKDYLHAILNEQALGETGFKLTLQIQVCDMEFPTTPNTAHAPREILYPNKPWNTDQYPWQDFADIVVSGLTPDDIKERARYDFAELPENITIATSPDLDPYTSLMSIQDKSLWSVGETKEQNEELKRKMITYLVEVETGYRMYAGTNAGVHIAIFGTEGRTPKLLMNKNFYNDFERGRKDAYYIKAPVVGDIKYIKLFLKGGKLAKDWYVRRVVIFDLDSRKSFDFPCHTWVTVDVTIPVGTASIINHEVEPDLSNLRQLEVQQKKDAYPWCKEDGLPGRIGVECYKDLPRELKFPTTLEWEKRGIILHSMSKLGIQKMTTIFQPFKDFDDFKMFAETLQTSENVAYIMQNWKKDEEFGRQFLAGANPVVLERMTKAVDKFPVCEELIIGFLNRDMSLQEEMEAGHIYWVDYGDLDGIPRLKGDKPRYVSSPMCMFYVRSSGELVPIAIQLEQKPGVDNLIWTPNDKELEWLFAKMWVRCADTQHHNLCSHLLKAHFLTETFAVATHRNLPSSHPAFKLLLPHLSHVISINTILREKIIDEKKSLLRDLLALDDCHLEYAKKKFRKMTWKSLSISQDLVLRGVDDTEALPNYYFRDDALRLWNVISEYVQGLTALYYEGDGDVIADSEIQHWMKDIHDNGLAFCFQEEGNTVPTSVESLDDLNAILTMVIANATVFHSAVNYSSMDIYAFCPNAPAFMKEPPPMKKGTITVDKIMKALPTKGEQSTFIAFPYFLSQYTDNEAFLGEFPDTHFCEPDAFEIMVAFRKELQIVSEEIQERNQSLPVSYAYLLPGKIPNSVSV